MRWTLQTLFTLIAAICCIVGGGIMAVRHPESGAAAGTALVGLGAGLGGWLLRQPSFANKESTDGQEQGTQGR
jgi:hypothetical protein